MCCDCALRHLGPGSRNGHPDVYCVCMPTALQYQQAIASVLARSPDSYRRMLEANFRAKNHTLTPLELAHAAGYQHVSAVNLHYGKLGARVSQELGYVPAKLSLQGRPCLTFVLANWSALRSAWVLLPEVIEALEYIGWSQERP